MQEDLRCLSDRDLIDRLHRIAAHERKATAALVAHLAEVERRGLHRDAGYGSMFEYCVKLLRLSEAAAYTRIYAARLSRRFPAVLEALRAGRLHLSGLRVLGPRLDADNHAELLAAASDRSRADIEQLLAERFPAAAVPEVVRTFVSDDGHRCEARERLEYHHERAFARGGAPSVENIRLLCAAHNQLLAERDFGPLFIAGKRSPRGESRV